LAVSDVFRGSGASRLKYLRNTFAPRCVGVGGLAYTNFEEVRPGKVRFGGTPKVRAGLA
jgi:hypothetical protein